MSDPGNIRERAQAGEGERPKSLTAKVTNIVNFLNLDEEEMVKRSELHYERFDALRSQYFKDKRISRNDKFTITYYLKRYMVLEDQRRYEDMKSQYNWIVNIVSFVSLANVVAFAALYREFMKKKKWQQIGISVGVFLVSHNIGMQHPKREAEKLNESLIDKYKDTVYKLDLEDVKQTHKLNKAWL